MSLTLIPSLYSLTSVFSPFGLNSISPCITTLNSLSPSQVSLLSLVLVSHTGSSHGSLSPCIATLNSLSPCITTLFSMPNITSFTQAPGIPFPHPLAADNTLKSLNLLEMYIDRPSPCSC